MKTFSMSQIASGLWQFFMCVVRTNIKQRQPTAILGPLSKPDIFPQVESLLEGLIF